METQETIQIQTQARPISERFECIGECVLLRRIEEADDITEGGIHKPEIARRKSHRGEVVALGEGRVIGDRWMPLGLEIGEIVRFSKHAIGVEEDIDGVIYLKLHWKQLHIREKNPCAIL